MEKEFSENQILEQINTAFFLVDQNRNESLEQFSDVQQVQVSLLKIEQDRLREKYGASHPRVLQSEVKLSVATGLSHELRTEVAKTKIKAPPYNPKTWRCHGRVLTSEREGIEALMLSLFNENKRWVRALGIACSNEQGYFVIDYPTQGIAEAKVSPAQPLILTVTDNDRQIIHQETLPLFVKLGIIDYREIILDGKLKIVVPPEAEDSTPPSDTST